ncbi:MAG: glutamine-hydrolyzing carbamoyl-phosphate synthase small subunit [Smithellaceae bacterium]|nr:glutamine-hydrolyzing carbamoyl-phosphate synthase small subunit [Smithellaceae bacterium]
MLLKKKRRPAWLLLEDGTLYEGSAFAGDGEVLGEVVFNTGMTGYQEVITDPSYKDQIVVMTYPLVGNYGINQEDMESAGIHLEGLVVREYQDFYSNWRADRSLGAFLEEQGKLGVEGIDTRALTRRIRLQGAMRGIISTRTGDREELLARVNAWPGLVGRDLVRLVTCRESYRWEDGKVLSLNSPPPKGERLRVVVLDCGVKYNILRHLEGLGHEVIVVPAACDAGEIIAMAPDGILLSNGPGDPAALPYLVETVRGVLGKAPIFGICLGHQILGQALGGRTEKLKFGHHGINQPVKNRATGRVEITSQNHGFTVLPESLPGEVTPTYDNLNDATSEGIMVKGLRAFSVQYHPEAAPGPNDVAYLFETFQQAMKASGTCSGSPKGSERVPGTKEGRAI